MNRPLTTKRLSLALASLAALGALAAATPADALPNCKPGSGCGVPPPPPPPPPPPTYTSTITPHCQVVTILYAPPGNKSTVTYGDGSTVGTTVSTDSSFKDGISISASGIFGSIGASGSFSATTDAKASIKETSATSWSSTLNSPSDEIDHDNDVFYVWVNPAMSMTQQGNNTEITWVGTSGSSSMEIVPLTAAQLRTPSTIPSFYQPYLTHVTAADYAQMLSLDPYASSTYVDPSRFVSTGTSLPIDGTLISSGAQDVNTSTVTNSNQWSLEYSVGFDVSQGIPDIATIKVSDTLTWSSSSTIETTSETQNSIQVALKTSTASFGGLYDVFYDRAFQSFSFVPAPTWIIYPIGGRLLNKSGGAIQSERVTLSDTSGHVLTTYTNAQGEYRFHDVPAGDVLVEAHGKVTRAHVTAGERAEVNLRAE